MKNITNITNITNINMEDIMKTTVHTLDHMSMAEAAAWGWEPAGPMAVISWAPTAEAVKGGGVELWASWEEAEKAIREIVDWTPGPWIEWDKRPAIAGAVAAQACAEVRGTEEEPAWVQFRPEFAGDDDALDRLIEMAITAGEE